LTTGKPRAKPQSILVTGGSGFVGSQLITLLAETYPDAQITATGLTETPPSLGHIKGVRINLSSGDVATLLAKIKPDVVVHLAARSSVQQAIGAAGLTFHDNLMGSLRLIDAIKTKAPDCLLVHASTGEVYGSAFPADAAASERNPLSPTNAYSHSKLAIEFAIQDILSDSHTSIILRPFNHFGPGQDERFVVASFAAQLARIERGLVPPVIKVGNLEAKRDFMDVRDMLAAYVAAIDLGFGGNKGSQLYNVCSGSGRAIRSVLDDLLAASSVRPQVQLDPSRMRPSDIPNAVGDASAFHAATGWQPITPWQTSITRVMDGWRQSLETATD
jgi:GDP-4-dehydro-6-deoxy-D-mannose reductase